MASWSLHAMQALDCTFLATAEWWHCPGAGTSTLCTSCQHLLAHTFTQESSTSVLVPLHSYNHRNIEP